MKQPNILFVFADQWRHSAFGYAGNRQVKTPNIDAFAAESIDFTHAVSGCPVCCPARASLLTGQYPLTHGVFMNDAPLGNQAVSVAQALAGAGYDTGYIGKWHVNAGGRSKYIPRERRQGFDYWKVLECTHNYNESYYYAGDDPTKRMWEGYDAIAQTRDACEYIRGREDESKPYLLMLSWGPPHDPYETAPAKYQAMYPKESIEVPPNVPAEFVEEAKEWISGYYAHCTALDACFAELIKIVDDNTIVIFTSDHGDMLRSHGMFGKQKPWDESIRVPLLIRLPGQREGRKDDAMIDWPDLMPTMLGLAGVAIPESVETVDFSGYIRNGGNDPSGGAAVIHMPVPFSSYAAQFGGEEYRGLRTNRYTYARRLGGPWILYDNDVDPYQMKNLIDDPAYAKVRGELDAELDRRLAGRGDKFEPGEVYVERWGYGPVDAYGAIPYTK